MGRKHGQETPIDASAECARLHTDRRTGDFMTIDRDSFLKKYNIELEDFQAAGMPWEELAAIYEDYQANEGKLRNIGKDFVYDYLYDIEKAGIHSYRYRTKDPGHLLEKIIRKRNEQFDRFETINRDNYYNLTVLARRSYNLYSDVQKITTNM